MTQNPTTCHKGVPMLSLRPYKPCDAEIIASWIKNEDIYLKWGGKLFCDYPIPAEVIDEKYRSKNGDCEEPDNFYPWVAVNDEGKVVGHFIMRYLKGDHKLLRFGWVIVDDSIRGKGYGTEMLRMGLKYAFEFLNVERITLGVFEGNEIAHSCYKKVGFKDFEIVEKEPWNLIEMDIKKSDYLH